MLDILSIEPTTVSRDLRGKYVCIFGPAKAGKTSLAAHFPKSLLCAFEIGYHAIGGIHAVDIDRWATFKLVCRQLKKQEAKDMYDTIIIDTASIAYDLCEKFICANNGVQKINEIPYGQGWGLVQKEFEDTLRDITQLGYGLVIIAHSKQTEEAAGTEEGVTKTIYQPDLSKRCYSVVNKLVDIIGFINVEWNEDGTSERYLITRRTPTIMAGSRFPYLAPKIKLGYQELVDAISDAIEMQEKLDGVKVVDHQEIHEVQNLDFDAIRDRANTLWTELFSTGTEEEKVDLNEKIMLYVEQTLGKPKKLSEITRQEVEGFYLIEQYLEELVHSQEKKNGN